MGGARARKMCLLDRGRRLTRGKHREQQNHGREGAPGQEVLILREWGRGESALAAVGPWGCIGAAGQRAQLRGAEQAAIAVTGCGCWLSARQCSRAEQGQRCSPCRPRPPIFRLRGARRRGSLDGRREVGGGGLAAKQVCRLGLHLSRRRRSKASRAGRARSPLSAFEAFFWQFPTQPAVQEGRGGARGAGEARIAASVGRKRAQVALGRQALDATESATQGCELTEADEDHQVDAENDDCVCERERGRGRGAAAASGRGTPAAGRARACGKDRKSNRRAQNGSSPVPTTMSLPGMIPAERSFGAQASARNGTGKGAAGWTSGGS